MNISIVRLDTDIMMSMLTSLCVCSQCRHLLFLLKLLLGGDFTVYFGHIVLIPRHLVSDCWQVC